MRLVFLAFVLLAALAEPGHGLEPANVFLVVNKNEPKSRQVADHYCQLRKVPAGNVVELDLPTVEDINRDDYEAKVVKPLRLALRSRAAQVKVLLSTYGVPLRVGPLSPTEEEMRQLVGVRADLEEKRKAAEMRAKTVKSLEEELQKANLTSLQARVDELKKEVAAMNKHIHELQQTARRLAHDESHAAFDSELMLLWWPDYQRDRWMVNPLYWQVPDLMRRNWAPVVMTCRIDGPTADVAMRIVSDAVWAEEHGLKGKAYIDARGIRYDPAADITGTAYGGYDQSMREAAKLLADEAKLDVKLEDTESLYEKDSCDDAAIYCGWYSVRNYISCCRFNRGAIAWHLASFEMLSLRNPQTQWCGNLLLDGACATLGPVAEPYTVAFPKPEEFFGFLVSGEYTLVESYARTSMLTSWMNCLVGDPLYNPYKKEPRLRGFAVWPSPKGSKFMLGP